VNRKRAILIAASAILGISVAGCGGGHAMTPPASVPAGPGLGSTGFAEHAPMAVNQAARVMDGLHPRAVSPGTVPAPPFDRSLRIGAGWMAAHTSRGARPQSLVALNWNQLPGSAVQAAASPDGSVWALATAGSGPDYQIVHYASGAWTVVPGSAKQLAVSADGQTLYAVNAAGGIYGMNVATGVWTPIAGGASAITVALDGSLFVTSNAGDDGTGNKPIFHYQNGTWTQLPGDGAGLSGSWDPSSYPIDGGTVSPNGFYVYNSSGELFYYSPGTGYVYAPGTVLGVAAVPGGLFALGTGNAMYFYSLVQQGWSIEAGSGSSISAAGTQLLIVNGSQQIWQTPAQPFYAFGGSDSGSVPATSGSAPGLVSLAAYEGLSLTIDLPTVVSGTGTLDFTDAFDNGDIVPNLMLPDDTVNGPIVNSTIVYVSVLNSGTETISFGAMLPMVTIFESSGLGFAPFSTCQIDALAETSGPFFHWISYPPSPSSGSMFTTIGPATLSGLNVQFPPGQTIVAVSCTPISM
jgi:hypothetical protein